MRIKFESDEFPMQIVDAMIGAIIGGHFITRVTAEKEKDTDKWVGVIETVPGENVYINGHPIYQELPLPSRQVRLERSAKIVFAPTLIPTGR